MSSHPPTEPVLNFQMLSIFGSRPKPRHLKHGGTQLGRVAQQLSRGTGAARTLDLRHPNGLRRFALPEKHGRGGG